MPGASEDLQPVTVDLNGEVIIRARESNPSRCTDLLLARSKTSGPPVRFSFTRVFLARAARLHFSEMLVVNADTPVLFQDEKRTYVVMPLEKQFALGPSDDAVRIVSAEAQPVPHPSTVPAEPQPVTHPTTVERRKRIMPTPSTNGHSAANGNGAFNGEPVKAVRSAPTPGSSSGSNALINETLALKAMLREAYTRTNQLLAALKKQKKQSQAVQATLASLRQLQHIDG